MDDLAITYEIDHPAPDCTRIRLAGELDLGAASELETTLRDHVGGAQLTVLDLGDLSFIDSSGIRLLIQAGTRRLGAPLPEVVLILPRARVPRKALEVIGIRQVVPVADDLSSVLARCVF